MRISDCSSDVCSSDLLARGFVQQRGDHFAGAAPGSPVIDQDGNVGVDDVGLERGITDVFDGFAHDRKKKRMMGDRKTIREGRATTQCILLIAQCDLLRSFNKHTTVGATAHSSVCRVSGRFRSEEHTSELQSLMRISYTVFCLKKK